MANGPAKQAAMMCNDDKFLLYLDARTRAKNGLTESDLPDGTHSSDDARMAICSACKVTSRAGIKGSPAAMEMLGRIISDFNRWKARNGLI